MARRRDIQLGPFSGLNDRFSPDTIQDNQLHKALNVIVSIEGFLHPRPGFMKYDNFPYTLQAGERLDVIGSIDEAVYVAVATPVGDKYKTTKIFRGTKTPYGGRVSINEYYTMTWEDTGFVASQDYYIIRLHAYVNDVYAICSSCNSDPMIAPTTGGYKLTNGVDGVFTSVANVASMPQVYNNPKNNEKNLGAYLSFIWKERLWICDALDTIYYSEAGNPSNWTVGTDLAGYISFDPANNEKYITDTLIVGDALYVFKTDKVFQFTYQSDPGQDEYVRKISETIGAISAVNYQGRIFLVNELSVYELVSGQFINIAPYIAVERNIQTSLTQKIMWIVGDYLVIGPTNFTYDGHAEGGFSYYVCNLRSMTWTEWRPYNKSYNFYNTLFSNDSRDARYNVAMGVSEDGRTLIGINFYRSGTSEVCFDGLVSSVGSRRMPVYSVETKHLSFTQNTFYKRIYRIMVNRGTSGTLGPLTAAVKDKFRHKTGFGYRFTTQVVDTPDGTELPHSYKADMNVQFGLMPESSFRCLEFCLTFRQESQGQQDNDFLDASIYFNINPFLISIDSKADLSNYGPIGGILGGLKR